MRTQWALVVGAIFVPIANAKAQNSLGATGTLVPNRVTSSPIVSAGTERVPAGDGGEREIGAGQALSSAQKMAACTTKSKPSEVKAFLEAPNSTRVASTMKTLTSKNSSCFVSTLPGQESGKLTFGYRTYYDLFAEAYLRQYGMPKLATVSLSELQASEDYQTSTPLTKIATCLAYTQPERAQAVVYAAMGSVAEQTAYTAIAPFISGCFETGITMKLNRVALRLRLASAVYMRGIEYPMDRNSTPTADRGK